MTAGRARPEQDVVFVFRGDRSALVAEYAAGRAPCEFLYGMPFVGDAERRVDFVHDPRPFTDMRGRLLRPLQTWFGRRYSIGLNLHSYLANERRLAAADRIVTTVDSYGLPVLWGRRSGRIRARVIYMSQGLYPIARRARRNRLDEQVRRAVAALLRYADRLVVFGDGDRDALLGAFGDLVPLDIHVVMFGIDERFWTPDQRPADADAAIVSVGSDGLRDYRTLVLAADRRPLRIVTRMAVPEAAGRPNVTVGGEIGWVELRDLVRRCRLLVTPLQDEPRNSGHSATLQGMACGKTVILSDTPGLWDRRNMRHLETCYLVPPGDEAALRAAIRYFEERPDEAERIGRNARKLVETAYTASGFGARMKDLLA